MGGEKVTASDEGPIAGPEPGWLLRSSTYRSSSFGVSGIW